MKKPEWVLAWEDGQEDCHAGRRVPETNLEFLAMVIGGLIAFGRRLRKWRPHWPPFGKKKERKASKPAGQMKSVSWHAVKAYRRLSAWCWRWRVWLCRVPALFLCIAAVFAKSRFGLLTACAGLLLSVCLYYRKTISCRGAWKFTPETEEPLPRLARLDTALFADAVQTVADVWTPFETMTHEQFRGSTKALMLSAAAALTVDCLPEDYAATSHEWLRSLGINRDNFRKSFPLMDEARYDVFRGVAVKDGTLQRAYFVGDSRLPLRCTRLMDNGRWRPIVQGDRAKIDAMPEDAVYYATAEFTEEGLDRMLLLGCIRTRKVLKPSFGMLDAVEKIRQMGFGVCCAQPKKNAVNPVKELKIPVPEWDGVSPAVDLEPSMAGDQAGYGECRAMGYLPEKVPRDADHALQDALAWQENVRGFRLRALTLACGAALAALILPRGIEFNFLPALALAVFVCCSWSLLLRGGCAKSRISKPVWGTVFAALLVGLVAAALTAAFTVTFEPAAQLASAILFSVSAPLAAVLRLRALLVFDKAWRPAPVDCLLLTAMAVFILWAMVSSPLAGLFGAGCGTAMMLSAEGTVRIGCWASMKQKHGMKE